DITQSTSGYVFISSNSGTSVAPSETFTISIQVFSFTEAQSNTIATGFPSGTPGRGNNKDFTFDATQKSASIDGSGKSNIINFQVTAPSIEDSYTLHADAIFRAGGSASYFAHGDFIITVETQNTPPQFSNILENADPLELGQTETFNVDVSDSETDVSMVFIELNNMNYTMVNIIGNSYEYNWTPSSTGLKNYIIYANDTDGAWNSTSGSIIVTDTTNPILSSLVESADPLELGQTEIIQINATDLSGISQVLIEINNVNYTMTNIYGSTWEYNNWIPNTVGLKAYTIYVNDSEGNWNSINDDITVEDTISPEFDFLIESADPLPLGQNETISIEVYDTFGSGVKEVLLEYENTNHTMVFIGLNTWMWSNWQPITIGNFGYSIYMIDNSNNLNSTSGSIEVIILTGPTIQNLSKSADPLELGQFETIQVDINDTDGVSGVFIEIGNINYTMTNIGGIRYEYTWIPNTTGTKLFKIYANDSLNNFNQFSGSILVKDTTPPNFANLIINSNPLELGNKLNISIDLTDISGIDQVLIEYGGANHSMSNIGGDTWIYNNWIPNSTNMYSYNIFFQDNFNNWNMISDSIEVIDTTAPQFTNLHESNDQLELGLTETIQIDVIDLSPINSVFIEIEGLNYTMIKINSLTWEYNDWSPTSTGLKIYTIYAIDLSDNEISLISNITIIDTNGPNFFNLTKSSESIFFGQNISIQIEVLDLSGISEVLIEFEGSNHTMISTNGDLWEYYDWNPNSIGEITFTIHAKDNNNRWNSIQDAIMVNQPINNINALTLNDIKELAIFSGIIGLIVIGMVLIIKTVKSRRFIH
ncbi:MAG: hypothetical protein ACFFKA_13435, partial [Candidatus Thorarchaeota archaeon]